MDSIIKLISSSNISIEKHHNQKSPQDIETIKDASDVSIATSGSDRSSDSENNIHHEKKKAPTKSPSYNYKDDSNNPKNWTKERKFVCLSIVLWISFMPYFSSAIYVPASHDMMIAFDTNLTAITATFSLYLMMNGIVPLFWAPLSEKIGRKWVYTTAMLFYTVFSVLCAVSVNFAMFFVFRVLQGCFVCAAQALGGGTISDIVDPHERGRIMSYYIFSLVVSSPVGTVVGGIIDEKLGFRWIFYILAIIGGTITVISFFFLEDTLYIHEVQNHATPTISSVKDRFALIFSFNPLKTLLLFRNLDILLTSLQVGVAFGCYYFFLAVLPPTFGPVYNFSPSQVGLCFVPGGIGSCLGTITAGSISDKYCAKIAAKNGGIAVKEARLRLAFYVLPCLLIGTTMYGWFIDSKLHWIVPLISLAISSYGITFTTTVCATFLIDTNLQRAASVIALNNFSRSLFSMILSLSSVKLRDAMGNGWVYTFLGLLTTIIYCICTPLVIKYGNKWRGNRN